MQDDDVLGDAIERLEWDEKRSGQPRWSQVTRRTALGGGAAGLAAALLAACGGSSAATTPTTTVASGAAAAVFASEQTFKFTIVNQAMLSDVFTATQNGAADACKLLGCTYDWTGSASADVTEMVMAIETAVTAGVDGIVTSLVDKTAFNLPVSRAIDAGVPVVAYNSDAPGNARLAYVGSDPYRGGHEMGERILSLMPGGGQIAVFIAVPGATGLSRRAAGLTDALKGSGVAAEVFASGPAATQQSAAIDAFITAHPSFDGFFAVDGGSTSVLASAIQDSGLAAKGVLGGGYDLAPTTQQLLASGDIQFTVDEQLYLQGFLPILELYLYRVSQRLIQPAGVDTGVRLIDQQAAGAYTKTTSRFEATATSPGVHSS